MVNPYIYSMANKRYLQRATSATLPYGKEILIRIAATLL